MRATSKHAQERKNENVGSLLRTLLGIRKRDQLDEEPIYGAWDKNQYRRLAAGGTMTSTNLKSHQSHFMGQSFFNQRPSLAYWTTPDSLSN